MLGKLFAKKLSFLKDNRGIAPLFILVLIAAAILAVPITNTLVQNKNLNTQSSQTLSYSNYNQGPAVLGARVETHCNDWRWSFKCDKNDPEKRRILLSSILSGSGTPQYCPENTQCKNIGWFEGCGPGHGVACDSTTTTPKTCEEKYGTGWICSLNGQSPPPSDYEIKDGTGICQNDIPCVKPKSTSTPTPTPTPNSPTPTPTPLPTASLCSDYELFFGAIGGGAECKTAGNCDSNVGISVTTDDCTKINQVCCVRIFSVQITLAPTTAPGVPTPTTKPVVPRPTTPPGTPCTSTGEMCGKGDRSNVPNTCTYGNASSKDTWCQNTTKDNQTYCYSCNASTTPIPINAPAPVACDPANPTSINNCGNSNFGYLGVCNNGQGLWSYSSDNAKDNWCRINAGGTRAYCYICTPTSSNPVPTVGASTPTPTPAQATSCPDINPDGSHNACRATQCGAGEKDQGFAADQACNSFYGGAINKCCQLPSSSGSPGPSCKDPQKKCDLSKNQSNGANLDCMGCGGVCVNTGVYSGSGQCVAQ